MTALIAALVAPIFGALFYGLLRGSTWAMRFVDRAMQVAIPLLVGFEVLRHGWEEFGILAVAAIALGIATPPLIRRASRVIAPHTDNISIVAAISGLALHAVLEGAALAPDGVGLQAAIILHRAPIGLLIWWMVRPRHGRTGGSIGLAALGVATLAGYGIGMQLVEQFESSIILYQAYVGGTLMHFVFHQGRHGRRPPHPPGP